MTIERIVEPCFCSAWQRVYKSTLHQTLTPNILQFFLNLPTFNYGLMDFNTGLGSSNRHAISGKAKEGIPEIARNRGALPAISTLLLGNEGGEGEMLGSRSFKLGDTLRS